MTSTYLVALDDETGNPWIYKFNAVDYLDAQDKVIDNIYNEFDLDGIKMPSDYDSFKKKCHSLDIFIGEIIELNE